MKQLSFVLKRALSRIQYPAMGQQVDRHNIYPKSRTDSGFNVHHASNIIRLNHQIHFGMHDLFTNCTPQEQLMVLLEVNKSVLSDQTIVCVRNLFEASEVDFYRKKLII